MPTITVAALKGGAGKTTTAVYLAAAAVRRGLGPVILVDTDPHGVAAAWLEAAPVPGVDVLEAPSERLATRHAASSGELRIIDTPHADERIVTAALAAASAVVIPSRVGATDALRIQPTRLLIGARPHGLVVVAAEPRTRDYHEFVDAWSGAGVAAWGSIPKRVGIAAGHLAPLHPDGLDAYGVVLDAALAAAGVAAR
jgi:chromosome partitioning protein